MKKIAVLGMVVISLLVLNACHSIKSKQKNTDQLSMVSLEKPRPAGQFNVLKLTADPIPVVRVAFIGVGNRGMLLSAAMSILKMWRLRYYVT